MISSPGFCSPRGIIPTSTTQVASPHGNEAATAPCHGGALPSSQTSSLEPPSLDVVAEPPQSTEHQPEYLS